MCATKVGSLAQYPHPMNHFGTAPLQMTSALLRLRRLIASPCRARALSLRRLRHAHDYCVPRWRRERRPHLIGWIVGSSAKMPSTRTIPFCAEAHLNVRSSCGLLSCSATLPGEDMTLTRRVVGPCLGSYIVRQVLYAKAGWCLSPRAPGGIRTRCPQRVWSRRGSYACFPQGDHLRKNLCRYALCGVKS